MPVLRAKASEWKALDLLTSGVRRRINPVLEFIPDWEPRPVTKGKRRSPQSPVEYVDRMLEQAEKVTPVGTESFLYFGLAGRKGQWKGIDLWKTFTSRNHAGGRLIPLADLASIAAAPTLTDAARVYGEFGIRVTSEEIAPGLADQLANARRKVGIPTRAMHVIFDLASTPAARSHAQMRTAIGDVGDIASLAVVSGVFPVDLTQYQPGISANAREEWSNWWQERIITSREKRLIRFGDFTTQCARYQRSPEVPGSVSLRYTVDNAVLVFRGRQSNSSTGLGHEQMHGHCRLLLHRPDYDGAAFSWGDHRIQSWTEPSNGTGNPSQWRTASLVHHITHVVAQLHDPAGSSASARAWARDQSGYAYT